MAPGGRRRQATETRVPALLWRDPAAIHAPMGSGPLRLWGEREQ